MAISVLTKMISVSCIRLVVPGEVLNLVIDHPVDYVFVITKLAFNLFDVLILTCPLYLMVFFPQLDHVISIELQLQLPFFLTFYFSLICAYVVTLLWFQSKLITTDLVLIIHKPTLRLRYQKCKFFLWSRRSW